MFFSDQTQQHRQLDVEEGSCWCNVSCIDKQTTLERPSVQDIYPTTSASESHQLTAVSHTAKIP